MSFGTIVLFGDAIDVCRGFRYILDTQLPGGVGLVVVEAPVIGGKAHPDDILTMGWMWRELSIACRRECIQIAKFPGKNGKLITGVYPGTLKKTAAGHGHATKPQMKAAARALGHAVTDDHQADAVLLLEHFAEPKKEPVQIAFSHTL